MFSSLCDALASVIAAGFLALAIAEWQRRVRHAHEFMHNAVRLDAVHDAREFT